MMLVGTGGVIKLPPALQTVPSTFSICENKDFRKSSFISRNLSPLINVRTSVGYMGVKTTKKTGINVLKVFHLQLPNRKYSSADESTMLNTIL